MCPIFLFYGFYGWEEQMMNGSQTESYFFNNVHELYFSYGIKFINFILFLSHFWDETPWSFVVYVESAILMDPSLAS